MELTQNLEHYGFSKNEATIYLYILRNGQSTAFSIASHTKIPRATVYLTLTGLQDKGFITSYKKNNVAQFVAESPNRLLKALKDKENTILESLPTLISLSKEKGIHPTVRFYTGKESIKSVFTSLYEDLEEKNIHKLYTISHPELQDFFPKYLPQVLEWKKKLKIHTSLIVPGNFEGKVPNSYKPDEFRETRFLPKQFPFHGTLMIAAEKIAIFSMKDDAVYAVTVESAVIADMLKQFFLFTWSMIGPSK